MLSQALYINHIINFGVIDISVLLLNYIF